MLPPNRKNFIELDLERLLGKHSFTYTTASRHVLQQPAGLAGQEKVLVGHVAIDRAGSRNNLDGESGQLKRSWSISACYIETPFDGLRVIPTPIAEDTTRQQMTNDGQPMAQHNHFRGAGQIAGIDSLVEFA